MVVKRRQSGVAAALASSLRKPRSVMEKLVLTSFKTAWPPNVETPGAERRSSTTVVSE